MKGFEFGSIEEQPFFDPWIGERYAQRLAADRDDVSMSGVMHRFHLMAESHYSDEPPFAGMTHKAVTELALQPNRYGAFWTKAIQVTENQPAAALDRARSWQDVAYSNFMQDVLSEPREAVPDAFWERGRKAFFAQLAITRPTVLVVLSKRLFAQLPNEGMRVPWKLTMQPDWPPVEDAWLYGYPIGDARHLTVAVSVGHPSGYGFSWERAARRAWSAMAFYSNIVAAFERGELTA